MTLTFAPKLLVGKTSVWVPTSYFFVFVKISFPVTHLMPYYTETGIPSYAFDALLCWNWHSQLRIWCPIMLKLAVLASWLTIYRQLYWLNKMKPVHTAHWLTTSGVNENTICLEMKANEKSSKHCKYSLSNLEFGVYRFHKAYLEEEQVSQWVFQSFFFQYMVSSLSLSLIQRNSRDTNLRQIQMTIFRCPLEEGACACALSSSHFVCLFVCR